MSSCMRNGKLQFVVAAVIALQIGSGCNAPSQDGPQETKTRDSQVNSSEDAVSTLRAFISYILRRDTDLFHDEAAQEKFFTKDLRSAVAHRRKLYEEFIKKHEAHSPPDNGTFVGAWEYPSGYIVEGARHSENQVVIEVIYKWEDPKANYYGDTRHVSYTFLIEDGLWKLNDAYTHAGKFVNPYSLKNDLRRDDHGF